MKFLKFNFFLILSILVLSCGKDDDNRDDDPTLEPIVLSGTESAPRVLESIFNNPARVDYVVNGTWSIESPVEVGPGVRFSMGPNAAIRVRGSGSLKVEGTDDRPVFFEGAESSPGFWQYIGFETNNPNNKLEHCFIAHGGGSTLSQFPGIVVLNSNAQASILHTSISESQRNGLQVSDNNSRLPVFENNTISNCALYPIVLRTSQMQFIDETTSFTTGNGFNQIEVQANTVNGPMIIRPAAGPYVLKGNANIEAPVEILPGTLIQMGPAARVRVRSSGSLKAVGTPEARITITGEQEAKGYWDYIHFDGTSSPNNEFQYVDLSYGGGSTLSCCGSIIAKGGGSSLKLGNSSITNSQRWGIRIRTNSVLEDLGGNVFSGNEAGDIDE
jgi:hypothetical protein